MDVEGARPNRLVNRRGPRPGRNVDRLWLRVVQGRHRQAGSAHGDRAQQGMFYRSGCTVTIPCNRF